MTPLRTIPAPGRPRWLRGLGAALLALSACQNTTTAANGVASAGPPPPEDLRRLDVHFPCGEVRCAAWLYLPRPAEEAFPPPVVVMAHGFGGTRGLFLPDYAESFARRGLAVFVFDYRSFGASEGEPRQVVRVEEQLDDWRSALRHVRQRREIDPERLGLWGTSLSGGHVLVIAAEEPGVRATVAQIPYIDADAGDPAPLGFRIRALWAITRDYVRSWTGRSPYYVPVLAAPGDFGAMNTPEAADALRTLIPDSMGWRNQVAARALLELSSYRPVARAARLSSPVLLVAAREDTLVPIETVARFGESLPDAEVVTLDGRHFDAYAEPQRTRALRVQARFLERHLTEFPRKTSHP